MFSRAITVLALALLCAPLYAQEDQNNQQSQQSTVNVEPMANTPVYRVNVVSRTTKAVNYRAKGAGSTTVDLRGTDLMPEAKGSAKVDPKSGRIEIEAKLDKMEPATKFGPEYLTYVLWAITPEGRPVNLGELRLNDDGNTSTKVTTDLQAFGLVVTAEPYFAVTRPSNLVVAENIIKSNTKGWERPIDAKFDLLERGQYRTEIPINQLPSVTAKPKTPLELLQARNAIAIAKADGAQQYASDSLQKAEADLARAEDYYSRKQSSSAIGTMARGATQQAEDARLLSLRRREQARLDAERQAAQQRTEEARARAEEATAQRQQAEQQALAAQQSAQQAQQQAELARQQAQQERAAAEQARQQAEAIRQQAEQQRQNAEAQQQAALQQQQQLQTEAQRAQFRAQQAEQEREQMRARLLQQLNQVLQTRDSARGLIVNMSDVLFDLNKATLKPGAKIRLAKVAGIIQAYPDLKLNIEGFTDSTGTPQYNQVLSEKRAATVRDYLISQGVPANNAMARGFGQADPVASNATPEGRQLNRRVDLVVSGTAIGTSMVPASPANSGAATGGTTGAAASTSAGSISNGANAGAAPAGNVGANAGAGSSSPDAGAGASAGATTSGAGVSAGAGASTPVASPSTGSGVARPATTPPVSQPAQNPPQH